MTEHEPELDRRHVLRVAVGAACLATLQSCRLFGGTTSELSDARAELERAIEAFDRDDLAEVRLLTIAREISSGARLLVEEQAAFLGDFNRLLGRYDVEAEGAAAFAREFGARRIRVRDGLFRLVGQLRSAVSDAEWTQIVAAITRQADQAVLRAY